MTAYDITEQTRVQKFLGGGGGRSPKNGLLLHFTIYEEGGDRRAPEMTENMFSYNKNVGIVA